MPSSSAGLAHHKISVIMPSGEDHIMHWDDIVNTGNRGIVLYFYPKDNTPGCTTQAQDFSSLVDDFESLGYAIYGVSKDDANSHQNFITSCSLSLPLISDTSLVLHEHFSTLGEKCIFGKVSVGTIRSTFVLDNEGSIIREWRNVRAKGHAHKVYQTLLSL